MKFNSFLITATVLFLTACSPKVTMSMLKTYPSLNNQEEIRVFALNEPVPPNAEILGNVRIDDNGFSTNCKYAVVLDMAKIEARKIGGNAIKITKHKKPDFVSTCHRINAEILRIDNIENYRAEPEPIDKAMLEAKYAIINVYRPSGAGFIVGYNLHLGDSVICRVRDGSWHSVKIFQEGNNTLWAATEAETEIPIKIEFGKTYYVRCGIDMGVLVGRPSLEIVDARIGKAEFDEIKSKRRLGSDRD